MPPRRAGAGRQGPTTVAQPVVSTRVFPVPDRFVHSLPVRAVLARSAILGNLYASVFRKARK
jgi:hypothetical protein